MPKLRGPPFPSISPLSFTFWHVGNHVSYSGMNYAMSEFACCLYLPHLSFNKVLARALSLMKQDFRSFVDILCRAEWWITQPVEHPWSNIWNNLPCLNFWKGHKSWESNGGLRVWRLQTRVSATANCSPASAYCACCTHTFSELVFRFSAHLPPCFLGFTSVNAADLGVAAVHRTCSAAGVSRAHWAAPLAVSCCCC